MKSKITISSTNILNSLSFVHIAASLSGDCAVKDINAPVSRPTYSFSKDFDFLVAIFNGIKG